MVIIRGGARRLGAGARGLGAERGLLAASASAAFVRRFRGRRAMAAFDSPLELVFARAGAASVFAPSWAILVRAAGEARGLAVREIQVVRDRILSVVRDRVVVAPGGGRAMMAAQRGPASRTAGALIDARADRVHVARGMHASAASAASPTRAGIAGHRPALRIAETADVEAAEAAARGAGPLAFAARRDRADVRVARGGDDLVPRMLARARRAGARFVAFVARSTTAPGPAARRPYAGVSLHAVHEPRADIAHAIRASTAPHHASLGPRAEMPGMAGVARTAMRAVQARSFLRVRPSSFGSIERFSEGRVTRVGRVGVVGVGTGRRESSARPRELGRTVAMSRAAGGTTRLEMAGLRGPATVHDRTLVAEGDDLARAASIRRSVGPRSAFVMSAPRPVLRLREPIVRLAPADAPASGVRAWRAQIEPLVFRRLRSEPSSGAPDRGHARAVLEHRSGGPAGGETPRPVPPAVDVRASVPPRPTPREVAAPIARASASLANREIEALADRVFDMFERRAAVRADRRGRA